jgi:hypothetical protein
VQAAQGIAAALANQNQVMQQVGQAVQGMNPPAQQQQAGQFHRAPLAAVPAGVIDYSTKEGKKHHEMATKPLFPKDEKFDVEPAKFQTFMHMLASRAKDLGFIQQGRIGMVPQDLIQPNAPLSNIFEDYGTRSLEQVRAHEETYIAVQNRNAQDSKILFDLLMLSISTQGHERITIWREQYILSIAGNEYEAGVCLLKVIVRESSLDSNATVSAIRYELSSLDSYISEHGSDILAFNRHVKDLTDGLNARGATTEDLLINLFKGYKACKDQAFLTYITQIENQHEDGTTTMSPNQLMDKAANYYKKRAVQKSQPWESDPIQDKFTALQAKLSKQFKGKQVNFKAGPKSPPGAAKKPAAGTKSDKPDWFKDNIKPKDPREVKVYNSNPYYWCGSESGGKCNGKWRQHPPWKCEGTSGEAKNRKKAPNSPKPKGKSKKQRTAKALKIIAAQEARLQKIKDEDSSENEEEEEVENASEEE